MEWQTSITYDEYEDAINEAVEALSLPHFYNTFFLHHVCPDLKEINCVVEKKNLENMHAYYKRNIHALVTSKKFISAEL